MFRYDRGEELTTFYGDNYFDENNKKCLCQSCENKLSDSRMNQQDSLLPAACSDTTSRVLRPKASTFSRVDNSINRINKKSVEKKIIPDTSPNENLDTSIVSSEIAKAKLSEVSNSSLTHEVFENNKENYYFLPAIRKLRNSKEY